MKYRRLSVKELEELEKEFIDFLIINGITADDWVKIKAETPETASRVIELFSDFIFDSILEKAMFMACKSKKELFTYQCLADKIVLVGITAPPESDADFTSQEYIDSAIRNPTEGLKIFTTEKEYSGSREAELFNMLENGCEITDGRMFKVLCLAL